MMADLTLGLRGRTGALLILAFATLGGIGLLAQATGDALDAEGQIAESRMLLGRIRVAANRPPLPAPLWAADAPSLLAAFRTRLDTLMAGRSILLDESRLVPDPARPAAPLLSATLRGTAEGLHGLLLALETQAPLAVVETARLGVLHPADPETGWPTVMQLSLNLRGALVAAPASGNAEAAR